MSDKSFYENELVIYSEDKFERDFKPYIENWLPETRRAFKGRNDIRVLDLGAGGCASTLFVSREAWAREIVAADISEHRMKMLIEQTAKTISGNREKISFAEINFNDPLPFEANRFDIVLMDASLHHSRNIWQTLIEVRRVLVPGGYFIGQREAYTSPLTNKITFSRLLKSPEIAAGVSENAYLKSQYDYYLRAVGFVPRFVPVLTRPIFKALFFANGWLFSKYNIIARSTKQGRDEASIFEERAEAA